MAGVLVNFHLLLQVALHLPPPWTAGARSSRAGEPRKGGREGRAQRRVFIPGSLGRRSLGLSFR